MNLCSFRIANNNDGPASEEIHCVFLILLSFIDDLIASIHTILYTCLGPSTIIGEVRRLVWPGLTRCAEHLANIEHIEWAWHVGHYLTVNRKITSLRNQIIEPRKLVVRTFARSDLYRVRMHYEHSRGNFAIRWLRNISLLSDCNCGEKTTSLTS